MMKSATKRKHDEFSSEDSEDSDSDFEDPDEIEVPGGGKNLQTITRIKSGGEGGTSGSSAAAARNKMKLIGDVTDTSGPSTSAGGTAGRSVLKRLHQPASAAGSSTSSSNSSIPVYDVPDDDGLEILKEIPGKSARRRMGGLSPSAMVGSYMGSGGPYGGLNPYMAATLMNAQDPFNSANPTDLLQKSIQNGGLSRILGNNGAFPLSGGAAFGGLGVGGMMGGLSGSSGSPFSQMSGGGMLPPVSAGGSFGAAASAMGLQSRQISNLWMNKPSALRRDAPGLQEDEEVAAEDEDDMGVIETYSNYMPSKLKIGKPHPDPVVETASMASVEPPDVWYDLALPDDLVDEGRLSALQLEAVTYASQQHEQFLADGNRAGFLIGDGAGVGKGRTIAGIIYENYLKGRKRAVWVSVSNDLKYDSERDLSDIGAKGIDVYFLSKMKYAKINSSINGNVRKGVIYSTYSALIGESQAGSNKYKTRLKQLLHWCGEDFDGVIVFDECHRAKNLCPTGAGKPTKTGQTVLELQQRLPKARIVYASATGASEPKHMAYMVRLGIWGPGSPFKNFEEFLRAVEKRGVGAMEIVAMDMKLRGMYIARQLSFQGVSFRVDEVELPEDFRLIYDRSVELWVELLHRFEEAAALIDADKKMRKTMWGQFWSSHQRFFKYLCIASKVRHVIAVATEVIRMGKCVVIGLQSTGEARTMEALEREEELTDFVSTAKGVLQSLVEKHFPAPDRNRINRVLGDLQPKKSLLEELGILKREGSSAGDIPNNGASTTAGPSNGKKKLKRKAAEKKRFKFDDGEASSGGENSDAGSEFAVSGVDDEEDDDDEFEEIEEEEEEEDFNPFGSGSDDDDDPWARKSKKKQPKKKARKKAKAPPPPADPFAHLFKPKKEETSDSNSAFGMGLGGGRFSSVSNTPSASQSAAPSPRPPPPQSSVDRACLMKEELLAKIEKLGSDLPANTLDQLIDELGGPENVSEMTGRKGRVVQDESGDVRYESRSEQDIPLETLNLTEKDRFMRGDKDVAIISEAASSGISLQADRRVQNRKRRVHMTLELPWSADRAIQQFGRTHRSNQVSAPEYVLLISDLAGEHRFASIVAKRLESLGALTHGDRRATESRDLSRFNIDNKYGRAALEATFKAIMGYEAPVVPPPQEYKGDFFKAVADGLVGVGLITQSEDNPGAIVLDKGHNDMSKFLNRILGMKVELQNLLFKYFSDTLSAIVTQAKRSGSYDQGILDVGLTEEDNVELVKTHTFLRRHATGTAKIELHVLTVERGLSWENAQNKWSELAGTEEGFYVSHQVRNNKKTAVLAVQVTRKKGSLSTSKSFVLYRPNTGQQVRQETLAELKKKYKKVTADEAEPHWNEQYSSSAKKCSHAYWRGNCKNSTMGVKCEVGLRRKTYNVLAGSVLSVWTQVEEVLTYDGNRRGANSRMQVVRLKLSNNKRIVGTLIPISAMQNLLKTLSAGSEESEETIY